jgi:glycosyltransferase involved in cell wall biosynthesis
MDNDIILSVVIYVYNSHRFLDRAIATVLEQEPEKKEIIIVDDVATVTIDEIAGQYLNDYRISYIINKTYYGKYKSFEIGLKIAQGKYVTFLSAEDYYLTGAFSIFHDGAIENLKNSIIYGKYCLVDNDDRNINILEHPGWHPLVREQRKNDFADLLRFGCYINISAAFFPRSLLMDVQFDTLINEPDYELILHLAHDNAQFHFIDQYILVARRKEERLQSIETPDLEQKSLLGHLELLNRYVVQQNYSRLAGFGEDIISLFLSKEAAIEQHPDKAVFILPVYKKKVKTTIRRIRKTFASSILLFCEPPLVSVILPTCNRPVMLVNAIKSILNQTYKNFEIIVINDGGCDVENLISPLNTDGKIRYIKLAENSGVSKARNTGIMVAKGKYVAYLDDDDVYFPCHIEILVDFLRKNCCKVAYTNATMAVQEKNGSDYITVKHGLLHSYNFNPDALLIRNLFPIICVMHEKSCLENIGLFDETMRVHEVWDLWIRLSRQFEFFHIKEATVEITCGDNYACTAEDYNLNIKKIYERYKEWTGNRQYILQVQKEIMNSHTGFSGSKYNEVSFFMKTIIYLVEQNEIENAIQYYDVNRKKYTSTIEMIQFDDVMGRLKAK